MSGWLSELIARTLPGSALRTVSPLGGGYANDVYRVELAGNGPPSVVVRAWRRDPAVAACELAVMRRARGRVPVPRVLAAVLTGERPAAVLEDMPGMRGDLALEAYPDEAQAIGFVLGEAFARLSVLQFPAAGFFVDETLSVSAFGGTAPQQLLAFARPQVWSGAARQALGPELRAAWWALIERAAPALAGLEVERSLVHADANPKNVLLQRGDTGWRISCVLDWEFSLSGPSLMDLGNLLRFESRDGTPFTEGVLEGWQRAGGPSHAACCAQARALDVYSLVGFVTAPQSALHERVLGLVRQQVREGRL